MTINKWRLAFLLVLGLQVLSCHATIAFHCPGKDVTDLTTSLVQYLDSEGIARTTYDLQLDADHSGFQLVNLGPIQSTNTLDLIYRPDIDLREELIQIPGEDRRPRTVVSVSKKEILLALLQAGRTTQFSGAACNREALQDQVGIRQNIVVWSESIEFKWPNGHAAHWNTRYWDHGNLKPRQSLHVAINDVFIHPQRYAIGCYTATKLVMIQGVLDYYRRIKKDVATASAVEARLMQDGDPLSYIEPGATWYFEKESSPQDLNRAGKLMTMTRGVASDNFVPGDWSYFLNTDPVTYEKTGYEGSNAIYLGRGKFDDYYNDNNHFYTYKEKLSEVYQWRHKVFSRSRDVARIHPRSASEIEALAHTPEQGGLQLDYRLSPYYFGFADLPAVHVSTQ